MYVNNKASDSYYFNPSHPHSFGGKSNLEPKSFWETNRFYTLHKPSRKRYPTRATLTTAPYYQFQADLNDMQQYVKENNGNKYRLTIIDVFSREAFAYPLKNKTSTSIIKAFQHLFSKKKMTAPRYLHVDQGREFINKQFITF